MSHNGRSFALEEGWSHCNGTSPTTLVIFDFFQEPTGLPVYMVNLNHLLGQFIRSKRQLDKALKICADATVWPVIPPTVQMFGNAQFCDSNALQLVLELLHAKNLIDRQWVGNIISSWKDVVAEFQEEGTTDKGKGEEGVEDAVLVPHPDNFPVFGNGRRKRQEQEEDDYEQLSEEEEEEEEEYEDVQEEFGVVGEDVEDDGDGRPMEYEEREHMIRLNCTTLESLSNAGAYLMSRSTALAGNPHARALEDIDATVVNVTRELQRFIPVGNQQAIQVEDVLDDEYAATAIRVGKRVAELGYTVDQKGYNKMLTDVGIQASKLHLQVYGRRPKKVRMMSGPGTSSTYINYYSERTAPRTLDPAIREWFDFRAKADAEWDRVLQEMMKKQKAREQEDEFDELVAEAEVKCLKCPRPSYPGTTLCLKCDTKERDAKRSKSSSSEPEPEPEPEKKRSLFSQFFGNL